MNAPMTSSEFRAELQKIMPGYAWTLRRNRIDGFMEAEGTQSSGFNRLSTLNVTRRDRDGQITYTAKSAGFGLRAPWLKEHTDGTLARALRGLQKHYESVAQTYRIHAADLEAGRKSADKSEVPA